MNELIEGVNWIAVLVGFVLSFFLEWVWFSPKMFGKKWAKGAVVSLEGDCTMPVFAMVAQAFGTLVWRG